MCWKSSWIACCMVVCALSVHAQVWERLSMLAPSDYLVDTKHLPSGRIVAVGNSGTVILSDDLGQSWRSVFSGSFHQLRSVEFVGDSLGWIVGDIGTILHTRDRGETWEVQFSESEHNFRDVEFVDPLHGWIVGEYGTYFRTADGGQTWSGQDFGNNHENDLLSVAFRDTLHGCAVGGQSRSHPPRILVTVDGGLNWDDAVYPNAHGWLADVEFVNDTTVVAVGRHHLVMRSVNQGMNWDTLAGFYNDTLEAIRDVEFLNPNYGLAVSDWGLLLQTYDGGIEWEALDPISPGRQGLSVISQDTILTAAIGTGIWLSTDGAESFSPGATVQTGNIIDIDFLSENVGWFLFEENVVWKTDNGNSFSIDTFAILSPIKSFDFVNENLGFAVTDEDVVYKTVDGGENWEARATGTQFELHMIKFANELRGWAVSDVATVLGTRDGGETWEVETTNTGGFLTSLAIIDEQHAWAVGAGGTLLRTRDGETWETLAQIDFEDFYGLHFLDTLTGFAVGGNGAIFKTQDGGETWTGTSIPEHTLFAVEFANELDGWVAGEDGALYRTTDGGETWQPAESQSVYHIKDIWVSPTRGWAGGVSGTILRADYVLPVDDREVELLPTQISLSVFPNPFNSTATLRFELPNAAKTQIVVYDLLGRVATALADRAFTAGSHTLNFDAGDLASGVYFVTIRTPEFSTTQKLLLLR